MGVGVQTPYSCDTAYPYLTELLTPIRIAGLRAHDIPTESGPLLVQASDDREVWVNTATGIYHYRGARWYGNTNQGEFMSEEDAQARGYRPARNGQFQGKI
jgi:hypothetical protein